MDELVLQQMAGLGVTGMIAYSLFKSFLQERNAMIENNKEEKEYLKAEITNTRNVFQAELKKDREIYISSIERIANSVNSLNDEMEVIKTDIKDIKTKLDK